MHLNGQIYAAVVAPMCCHVLQQQENMYCHMQKHGVLSTEKQRGIWAHFCFYTTQDIGRTALCIRGVISELVWILGMRCACWW